MEHYFLTAVIMLLTTAGLLSCDKGSPNTPPAPTKTETGFARSVNIGDNTRVSVFKDMNAGLPNTDNALVIPKGVFSFVYKEKVCITDTGRIYKYARKKGKLVQEGNIILLPGGAVAMYIIFTSNHKAYVSYRGLGKVVIINPTTMEKIGETDLAEYLLGKAVGDNSSEPVTSVIRDGTLYVALSQMRPTYVCGAGAYVVLTGTRTDEPIKVVSDPRASMASGESPAGDPFIDERDDIHFYCVVMFSYQPGIKEGFLRIKKGQTDFDRSYYFTLADADLAGVKGNRTSYAYVKVYGGSGEVYAYLSISGVASNPPDYVRDKYPQPFEISLHNKDCTRLGLSVVVGRTATLYKSGNDIVFDMFTDQGMGYSVYHPATATYRALKVKTPGAPYAVHELR